MSLPPHVDMLLFVHIFICLDCSHTVHISLVGQAHWKQTPYFWKVCEAMAAEKQTLTLKECGVKPAEEEEKNQTLTLKEYRPMPAERRALISKERLLL